MTRESQTPFRFAPLEVEPPRAAGFGPANKAPVSVFEFASQTSSPPVPIEHHALSDASEGGVVQAELIDELTSSGELVHREQVEALIAQAREEMREELTSLHQQEMEEQAVRHEEALSRAIGELARWREAITHQSTEFLLRLCETLTMHLVQRSLIEHPEHYITAVTPAIKELMGFENPRLYVPEFALGALTDRVHELQHAHPDHLEVEVYADDTLEAGDFRLEVSAGRIDADMDKRLEHLVETCRQRALTQFAGWDEEDVS